MLKSKQCFRFLFIVFLIFTLIPTSAFADNDDGTGGGNGQGLGKNKNIPLTLVRSSVSNGDSNVETNPTIQLDFNKNICNVTVLSNNKKCFHLTDENGQAVAIRLIFPDNQVQRDYKQQVFLQPVKDLNKNASYKVSVDSTVTAKNGTSIDNAHTFTFTTGNVRTDRENKILKKLGENIITYETAYGETADSIPVDKSGLDDPSQEEKADVGVIARIAAAILIALAVAFTILFLVLRRRKE